MTNLEQSKRFKLNKYSTLSNCLNAKYNNYKLFSKSKSTLGFIPDIRDFINVCLIEKLTDTLRLKMANFVISDSYMIYCNKNHAQDNHIFT